MRIVDLIEKKKNGFKLSKDEIDFIISSFTSGVMHDYQMSALAMAIYFKGMESDEIAYLTNAMMKSGEVIDLKDIPGIKVDKHSTGGVGDKVTPIVSPIIASFGIPVAKMSGRGLGFTGGTLDKLESIPGFNVFYTIENFKKQVKEINIAVIGQTNGLVPADKKLYALRDVTATVNSIPLIASSIMSKKLATGSDTILLDVKCGNAAFMKTYEQAYELGKTMFEIGKHLNKDVRIEITSMDQPLGKAIGNKNEIIESIDAIKGKMSKDLEEVILSSCATILQQAKVASSYEKGKQMTIEMIKSGKPFELFKKWVVAQGGDIDLLLSNDFWKPRFKKEIYAQEDGYMNIISAVEFGIVAMKIGAGRETKDEKIDFDAGINLNKQTGDIVNKGDLLFTLYSSNPISEDIISEISTAYNIIGEKKDNKVILGRIE